MPQAVSSLPSMANATGPVTRFLPLRSSNIASSGFSALLKSAVALTNLTRCVLSGVFGSATSTLNSLRANRPFGDRPGPPSGRLGSVSSSRRKRGDLLHVGLDRELRRPLRRCVAPAAGEPSAWASSVGRCRPGDESPCTTCHSG